LNRYARNAHRILSATEAPEKPTNRFIFKQNLAKFGHFPT
jgi:hypothetical protein